MNNSVAANNVEHAPLINENSLKRGSLAGKGAPFRRGNHGGPYVIIGHGQEELVPFDERPVVPEGYTLITTILAGVPSTMPETCAMMDFLSKEENRRMVENPLAARFDIKHALKNDIEHFQVYTAGQLMPKLSVNLMANFTTSITKENPESAPEKPKSAPEKPKSEKRAPEPPKFLRLYASKIFKSGIYEFPIPSFDDEISPSLKNITSNNIRTKNAGYKHESKCLKFRKFFKHNILELNDVQELYKHSLHPIPEYITHALSTFTTKPPKISVSGLGLALGKVPVTDLFEMLGPGIYYFIVCRASLDETGMDKIHMDNLYHELSSIINVDRIYYKNNDGVERMVTDPLKFYETFRISPYDLDYLNQVLSSINDLLGRPIDDMVKKQAILSLLEDIPDSIKRALRDKKYFSESYFDLYIESVTTSLARKEPLRRRSMQQQVRERRLTRRTQSQRRVSLRRRRKN
jgi:hypothetical protein